jgi:hydroxyacylglutathione hydrolase
MKLKKFPVGPMGTNCYIVIDEPTKTAAVVDPGYDAGFIYNKLNRAGVTCAMILLTHGHADHTCALDELRELTGAPVYVHAGDAKMLADPALSYARLTGAPDEPIGPPEHTVADGDKITLGGTVIEVMHTQGHTPGSVCYLIRDERGDTMLSGDTLFRGSIGCYDLAGGDFRTLMQSLRRIAALEGEWKVYPGHGPSTTLSRERETNMYMFQ